MIQQNWPEIRFLLLRAASLVCLAGVGYCAWCLYLLVTLQWFV